MADAGGGDADEGRHGRLGQWPKRVAGEVGKLKEVATRKEAAHAREEAHRQWRAHGMAAPVREGEHEVRAGLGKVLPGSGWPEKT